MFLENLSKKVLRCQSKLMMTLTSDCYQLCCPYCYDADLYKIGAKIKALTPTLTLNIQCEDEQSLTVNLKDTVQGQTRSVNKYIGK